MQGCTRNKAAATRDQVKQASSIALDLQTRRDDFQMQVSSQCVRQRSLLIVTKVSGFMLGLLSSALPSCESCVLCRGVVMIVKVSLSTLQQGPATGQRVPD